MHIATLGTVLLPLCLLTGCARTEVYSDAALTRREGVKYFPVARPVMLATKTDSCGHPVEVEVAYVPDTSAPRYVVPCQGLGQSGWTLTCKDGIAQDFTQSAGNAQLPEAIETLANAGVAFLAGRAALEELGYVKRSD